MEREQQTVLLDGSRSRNKLVWKGVEYDCTISTLTKGNTVVMGGFELTVALTLIVRKDIMPEPITADADIITADNNQFTVDTDHPPSTGKKLDLKKTFNQREYKVLSVREPGSGSHWEFELGSPNQ